MKIKNAIRQIIRSMGYDIVRYNTIRNIDVRLKRIFDFHEINMVLDVGANVGQFATKLRRIGYIGEIISFEPNVYAYSILQNKAMHDSSWEAYNYALGDSVGETIINIAENSVSSSILPILQLHLNAAPKSNFVQRENVELRSLDSLGDLIDLQRKNTFLKIDTQGFEEKVLIGAEKTLENIDIIQIEMSLAPLYEGEILFDEMHQQLLIKGYNLISIEPGLIDPNNGNVLQVDGIYHRTLSY